MYYRSGTGRRWRCCIGAGRRFVFTHQVAALICMKWRYGRQLEGLTLTRNRKSDSVNQCVYLKNNCAKFHPDPSRNDRVLGFFEEVAPTRTTTRWVAIWDQFLTQFLWIYKAIKQTVKCSLCGWLVYRCRQLSMRTWTHSSVCVSLRRTSQYWCCQHARVVYATCCSMKVLNSVSISFTRLLSTSHVSVLAFT